MRIGGLIVWLVALLVPVQLPAAEIRPRSILFLDQSDLRGPFYHEIFTAFRERITADMQSRTTLYTASLDLSRFNGAAYEQILRQYLKEKYRDRPIGAVRFRTRAAQRQMQRTMFLGQIHALNVVLAQCDRNHAGRYRALRVWLGMNVGRQDQDILEQAHAEARVRRRWPSIPPSP